MKILNSLQELWDYCKLCPICQQQNRDIELLVGPDGDFKLVEVIKEDGLLTIGCDTYGGARVKYYIDCLSNKYTISVDRHPHEEKPPFPFFFWINADCRLCHNSSVSTSDIEFPWDSNEIVIYDSKLIDREDLYLINGTDGFHVTMQPNFSNMVVSKLSFDSNVGILDEGDEWRYPIVDLDLSDISKAIHRLKTIIVFS